ncbi:MAG: DUF262 domain-containing protein [Oscillospiraceae bacterium]|jgi:hypothetical protein|nr:DUF262 domain-containing protein [Oscillospiraceae bacterium]
MSNYIIEPMSLITFLDETKLRLPRFQRKATWDKKQNFELAISIFQDYPVGVVIINQEQKISWLLDGRQRRNALTAMRDNPVELYEWARNYIGFKKTADIQEIVNAYWGKVEKYLQTEEVDQTTEVEDDSVNRDDDEDFTVFSVEEDSFDSARQRHGLKTLLDIILMVHQNKPSGSRWEQIFDFREFFPQLDYAPIKNGNKISPVRLRRFVLALIKGIEHDYDSDEVTQQNFVAYYMDNTYFQGDRSKFEMQVKQNWDSISNSIDVLSRSEKIFADARIGIIRLTNATPLDAQNIFSRINKGGTQLKAEELLSAKPYWNREVSVSDREVKDKVKEMYAKLEIPVSGTIVRWDLAATLISRIKDNNLVFDTGNSDKSKDGISMEKISLGFKLLSAIYKEGMSIKHVISLEKDEKINWDHDIDQLIENFNVIFSIISQDSFFQYLQSWKKPITQLLGKAIALEFATILWLDWKDKGKPRYSESGNMKALRRDARILFDRLVFEYATKTWRGSGDSKMSNDIKNWKMRIIPVNEDDWKKFVNDACNGSYNGQPTTVKLLRPVLFYYYVITCVSPGNQINVTFDVDHIIPKEIFESNRVIDQTFKDSLVNLALLPTKDNIAKKSKRLNEITDNWLKNQITMYTGIDEIDFQKYSDVTLLPTLREQRKKLFLDAFCANRASTLKN